MKTVPKSTLIKILTGVNSADQGSEIWIDDKRKLSPWDALSWYRCDLSGFSLFDNLSVVENIALGLR